MTPENRPDLSTPDDTLLTAYALGELAPDSDEHAAVEQRLADDPAARAEVAAILGTAETLAAALAAEPLPAPADRPRRWPFRLAAVAGLAAAAAVGFAVAWPFLDTDQPDAHRVAWQGPAGDRLGTEAGAKSSSFADEPAFGLTDALSDRNVGGGEAGGGGGGQSLFADGDGEAAENSVWQMTDGDDWRGAIVRNDNSTDFSTFYEAGARRIVPPPVAAPVPSGPMTLGLDAIVVQRQRVTPGAPHDYFLWSEALGDARRSQEPGFNTEAYDRIADNPFRVVWDRPVSTFSIDVDTASYANVRRFLDNGQLPPADAVRIEELVNYFDYGYTPPSVVAPGKGDAEVDGPPFSTDIEVTAAPWAPDHRLVRIGLKGIEVATDDRPAANLVFLIDVSGSMNAANKLPLVKAGLRELVQHLRMDDRVAIVVYAGASGLVLDSTADHDAVLVAVDNLRPGGSTNGAAGIELAYQVATKNHIHGGLNRVILCTDGDFNVGVTDRGALTRLIEEKANVPGAPTYLSVLGFGTGNVKDATMEQLSNVGDGNYGYVDTLAEARKLLGEQVNATLLTIAKDVKLQVEFNPAKVAAYRLIGYENRVLAREDFNDDTVDAGDIGAGHAVTALYELKLVEGGSEKPAPSVDELRYQRPAGLAEAAKADELLTLKLRYKLPGAAKEQGTSRLLSFPVADDVVDFAEANEATRWSAAVARFGMMLRGSPHAGTLTWPGLVEFVESQVDVEGARFADLTSEGVRRVEFARMVRAAAELAGAADRGPE
ncbi:MAG: von Willebrand factor type A domain-containing protein [Planctomycetota bacterium]